VGEKDAVTTAATAVPETLTCWGLLESPSLTFKVAVSVPTTEAVKVTFPVHEAPAASVAVQVLFAAAKSVSAAAGEPPVKV
jgi:hypothetical protein